MHLVISEPLQGDLVKVNAHTQLAASLCPPESSPALPHHSSSQLEVFTQQPHWVAAMTRSYMYVTAVSLPCLSGRTTNVLLLIRTSRQSSAICTSWMETVCQAFDVDEELSDELMTGSQGHTLKASSLCSFFCKPEKHPDVFN